MNDNESVSPTSLHVRQAKKGRQESVEWLVRRFSPLLLAQARYREQRAGRILRIEPEDTVNEVLFSALRKLPDLTLSQGRHTPAFVCYLSKTLLNRHNSLLRDAIRKRNVVELDLQTSGLEYKEIRTWIDEEAKGSLLDAIQSLDSRSRDVIVLRWIEGRSIQDVAQILSCEENTIAQRSKRALVKLRDKLPQDLEHELTI